MTTASTELRGNHPALPALPSDEVRRIMWRLGNRDDLQQLVRSARGVARSLVARLVAGGQRETSQWTPEKGQLLEALDAAGISSIFVDPQYGGTIDGPKNLATALAAYELAWVDGGAATCLVALGLALQPIIALGTEEQKKKYLSASVSHSGANPSARRILSDRAFAICGCRYGHAVGQSADRAAGRMEKRRCCTYRNVAVSPIIWILPSLSWRPSPRMIPVSKVPAWSFWKRGTRGHLIAGR